MNTRVDDVLDKALALAPDERSAVALALLDSLDGEDDLAVSDAWRAEIRCRKEALRSGSVQAVSWEQAKARLSVL